MTGSAWLALAGFIGLCLLVGSVGGALTAPAIAGWYHTLHAPPGNPPDWLFAPVWTLLYVLMGTAGWLVWRDGDVRPVRRELRAWGWQLLIGALWSVAFFGLRNPALGLGVILAFLASLGVVTWRFWRVRRLAGMLMAPTMLWVSYASWLNLGFWWLNRAGPL